MQNGVLTSGITVFVGWRLFDLLGLDRYNCWLQLLSSAALHGAVVGSFVLLKYLIYLQLNQSILELKGRESTMRLTVSLAQMDLVLGDPAANLRKAEDWTAEVPAP